MALKITNLSGGYDKNNIVTNFNAFFPKGSFTAIAGPNGAGKSTLLKILISELHINKGNAFVFGKDIETLSRIERARALSFVSQNGGTASDFTVRDFVAMGRFCHSGSNSNNNYNNSNNNNNNEESIEKAMEVTGITSLAGKLYSKISGGEAQLVKLARAVCQESPIMALDEPVNNLDPNHRLKLMQLLKGFCEENKTVICVLHDLNAILQWCDRVILMKDGKPFASGLCEEVLTEENVFEVYGVRPVTTENPKTGKRVFLF